MSLIKYPYTNLHEINLDWLIEEVKKCYSPENPPDMAVLSVNGMTGDVTLYTDPAAVLPEIEDTTWSLGRTAAGTLVGIKFNKTLPLQRMNGNSLFNIYDEGNPPPYPVTSVNGRTGSVSVQEAFFSLTGDTITFITDSPDHSWSLDRATVDGSISLRLDTTNNTPAAYLEYVSDDETITRTIKLLTPDDIPSSAGVVSVNGEAGVVTLTGDDIAQEEGSAVTVASAINTLGDDVENITDKIGNTAMGTQATTITGAVKEHNTAITNINNKLGNVGNTSVQDQLDTLNSKLTPVTVAIVPDENIELFTNTSTALEINGCFYVAVTAMAKVDIVNSTLFTLSSSKEVRKSVVIPMGIGTSQWTNNESGYCYASSRSFVGNVPQGKWFHIVAMIPCA